jgi:hypothetical protein
VELLLDDFLDYLDWFDRRRILQPAQLIGLGSDPVLGYHPPGIQNSQIGHMQAARWESGLDNSPMYDCVSMSQDNCPDLFDNATHRMLVCCWCSCWCWW